MSVAVRVGRATAPARRARPVADEADSRRHLRAVPEGYVPLRLRVRRRRRATVFTVVAVSVVVFGVAAAHASLITGQMRLQRVQDDVAEQQARYQRLRLEVAELESPERIVATAQQRLGMVPPPGISYLSPAGAVTMPDGDGPSDGAGTHVSGGTQAWATLKPYLGPVRP